MFCLAEHGWLLAFLQWAPPQAMRAGQTEEQNLMEENAFLGIVGTREV